MSANALAKALNVPHNRITAITAGQARRHGRDGASRSPRYFGTSADLWINLQAGYDREVAERELRASGSLAR